MLYFLARDQAHGLINETIALAPHLIRQSNLTLVLGSQGKFAETDDSEVLLRATSTKPLMQHQCPRSLKYAVVDDVERPIQIFR